MCGCLKDVPLPRSFSCHLSLRVRIENTRAHMHPTWASVTLNLAFVGVGACNARVSP